MTRALAVACALVLLGSVVVRSQQSRPPNPVVIVETMRGTFEIEMYAGEAPKTVAHVLALVRDGFYDGQRVHRAIPGFLVQWGDPRSREAGRQSEWGMGPDASSGHPIGVAEMPSGRKFVRGSVGLAHPGVPSRGDSQIFITLADRPDLNGRYTLFGRVVSGDEVPPQLQAGDVITRTYVKEPSPAQR